MDEIGYFLILNVSKHKILWCGLLEGEVSAEETLKDEFIYEKVITDIFKYE